jgi:hypothetical protein
LTVEYNSLAITTTSSNASRQYTLGNNTNVLLDSGNTFTKLETRLVEEIYTALGAALDNSTGLPLVDCTVRNWTGGLSFGFRNKTITVSFKDLIYTADGQCAVGITPIAAGSQQVLGIPFLRAAYGEFQVLQSAFTINMY